MDGFTQCLKLNYESLNKVNTGHVINLMSNDVSRFDKVSVNRHS